MTGAMARLTGRLTLPRRAIACCLVAACLALAAAAPAAAQTLTAGDVMDVARAAATAISSTNIVVAVVDRNGTPLATYLGPTATPNPGGDMIVGNFGTLVPAEDYAVGLARTGAFFSNSQAPLSSRTVRMISGIHFPQGIKNAPPAALYGIENTNRGCNYNVAFPLPQPASLFNGGAAACMNGNTVGCGTGIVTGKRDIFDSDPDAVDGGGVPIFKGGVLVGGVGVTGVGIDRNVTEFAAFTGSIPGPLFGPKVPSPGVIYLNGLALPFVNNTKRPPGVGPGVFVAAGFTALNAAAVVPEGFLFGPVASTTPAPPVGLGPGEVAAIINSGIVMARNTRAAIRLPLGSHTSMVLAVSDAAGNLLGVNRMPDSTIFSVDVAVTKSRNVIYFSSTTRNPLDIRGVPPGTAVTARTIGFGAMPLYPPGIDNTRSGPFFGDFTTDVANPCTQGFAPEPDPNHSGIIFFPGSIGIYKRGVLVGGFGVSGDGVEQDDFITAAGVTQSGGGDWNPILNPGYVPPLEIRADRIIIGDVRLPFFKFPRNPTLR
jgi:uncharacterized protein GlcG (DUF336 family)